MKLLKKRVNDFPTPYTFSAAMKEGAGTTKLSALVMGLGNMVNGQIGKGLAFLAVEIAYIVFMAVNGAHCLAMLPSLGWVEQEEVWNEALQIYEYTQGDNSVLILLYGVATVMVSILFICVWLGAVKSAYKSECLKKEGKHLNTFKEDLRTLLHENVQKLLMTPSLVFIFTLTVLPLIFMICMAFTNYSKIGNHLVLFDWVGFENFAALFDSNSILGYTFWSVLGWTLIWAFFATFTNYIFGMILAMVINRKGTRAKGFWRFCFVLSCAVPSFVSLLIMRTMLQPNGVLQNIPGELYEAAQVDGANVVQTFFKITLPYMLYVTTPYLIATFTGNVNNFNIIYLLSGGDPVTDLASTAGKTDLLVTWLYKLTIDKQYYNIGAVIGILTFVILAVASLLTYRNSKSYKEEGGF